MSTRTFLLLTGGAIVLLCALLQYDKYEQCLATRPASACPEVGPFISRSGAGFHYIGDAPLTNRRP